MDSIRSISSLSEGEVGTGKGGGNSMEAAEKRPESGNWERVAGTERD